MCGICGEVVFRGEPEVEGMYRAAKTLQSRGPDAGGFFVRHNLVVGHRRLSILDLSPASEQPMIDNDLGLGIVFNGCIYNFRELRATLEEAGYRFFSDGDTEVILKSYHAWGRNCVKRFKGMFAFALWERNTGLVMLARDRLGIKPLYFTQDRERIRFASTLPALLAAGVDKQLDPVAIHHFFSFHGAVPPPRTILMHVKKVAPATTILIQPNGEIQAEEYWSFDVGVQSLLDQQLNEDDWINAATEALAKAVERRTIADVPMGVLLSGGLDSSLLVALLAKRPSQEIRTFSIGFDSIGASKGHEFKYSDLVAKLFGTQHQRIHICSDRAITALPSAIAAMSEPMVSHDAVAFFLLSQEVSKQVKVVQSGQGADEIFAGYSWYPPFLETNDAAEEYRKRYFDWQHEDIARLLTSDWLRRDYSSDFVDEYFKAVRSPLAVDKALEIDAKIMLVDDPIKRVDNMTMAFGLEARVPFLDHELVELAAKMPVDLKIKDGGKYALKQLARRLLPAEIIDRPKGYFPVPSLRHLRGPFLDYVREIFAAPSARGRGLYRYGMIDHMLKYPEAGMSPKGHSRLWQAALLEGWLQAHAI